MISIWIGIDTLTFILALSPVHFISHTRAHYDQRFKIEFYSNKNRTIANYIHWKVHKECTLYTIVSSVFVNAFKSGSYWLNRMLINKQKSHRVVFRDLFFFSAFSSHLVPMCVCVCEQFFWCIMKYEVRFAWRWWWMCVKTCGWGCQWHGVVLCCIA